MVAPVKHVIQQDLLPILSGTDNSVTVHKIITLLAGELAFMKLLKH